ncbi:unnamed protein product [Caenorhabditis brenneri]
MPPSLMDMPDIAMRIILEKADFMANQSLRKTCLNFRNYIDEVKAESTLSKISVRIDPDVIYFQLSFDGCGLRVDYQKHEEGCLVVWSKANKTKERLFKNSDFIFLANQDIEMMLSHKKTLLKTLIIDVFHVPGKEEILEETSSRFLESLQNVLQSKFPRLQVNSFQMAVNDAEQLLEFLPYLDPRTLQKLTIVNAGDTVKILEMEKIVQLEQWKNAREFKLRKFFAETSIGSLTHFRRITITVAEMFTEKVKVLESAFVRTPSMQYLKVRYTHCESDENIIFSFGQPTNIRLHYISIGMNFPSFSRLRETYPDFDDFLDYFNAPLHLTALDIRVEPDRIRSQIHLNDNNIQIEYFQDSRGCLVSWYKNSIKTNKLLEEMDFLAVAFEDFEAVFKNSKEEVLDVLAMNFHFNITEDNTEEDDSLSVLAIKCHEHFSRLLKTQSRKVKSFEIAVTHRDQVLELLPNLDPNYLKNLKITGAKGIMKRGDIEELEMEGIIRMELWKNLEELEISTLWVQTSIQDLSHMKKVNISIKEVTMDDLNVLKQIFLNPSHLEIFKIFYEKCNVKSHLVELYGNPLEEKSRYGAVTWKCQRLRKTCYDLRSRIDDLKPDPSLTKLSIRVEPFVIYNHFWYEDEDCCNEYYNDEKGCAVLYYEMYKRKKKMLENVDFIQVACNDLKSILVFQKSLLENFTIEFHNGSRNGKEGNLENTATKFLNCLDLHTFSLKLKTFQATVTNQNQILNVVCGLDPEFLVNLTIKNANGNSEHLEKLEIGELVKTEQWKQVEVVNIINFVVDFRLEDFVHFQVVYIAVKTLSMGDITSVKEKLLTSSSLQLFKIRFEQCQTENNLIESFGQPLKTSDQYSKMPNDIFLTDLPDIALRKVLEKLDFVSVQCLRKSCHDLRNFIDDTNVTSTLTEAYVVLVPNSISLELIFPSLENQIRYENNENSGCKICYFKQNSFMTTEKIFIGSDFMTVAFRDLESMLRNQKTALNSLRIDFLMSQLFENFPGFFKRSIKTKRFQTTVINQDEIMRVLPVINEDHLEEIHINNMIVKKFNVLELDQVKETNQWKQCETVRILEFLVETPIQDFFHFKNVFVTYKRVTKEMVLELKEAFLASSHMECFQISFKENAHEQQLIDLYGPLFLIDMPLGRVERKWFFQTSEASQILVISLYSEYVRLNRIASDSMPFGAVAFP